MDSPPVVLTEAFPETFRIPLPSAPMVSEAARSVPPLTGASIMWMPCCVRYWPSCSAYAGGTVALAISTDPRAVLAHPLLNQACNVIVALAIGEFQAARAIMAQEPRRTVRAPRIMGQAYRLILDRLIARGFEPPRARVRLPRAKFLLIVLRNLI